MGTVTTVLGGVEPKALGHFQMHEHIYARATPASRNNPALCIDDEARSVNELTMYRAAGGGAILDAQPGGAGRDAHALARMSEASGVHIVAVTGYHLPVFYAPEHWIFSDDAPRLLERFLEELEQGCADGDSGQEQRAVRAGAVKAAIGAEGPIGRYALCLRAAAGAAARCGVPLILHTECGAGAVEAVALCEKEGLSPARVAVCHADRQAADFRPHEEIARTGAFLEYDTIDRTKYHDDEQERALILHMLSLGYEDRLLLSLDTTAARLQSYGGSPGLAFIRRDFLPSLGRAGVSHSALRRICVENPLRIFGHAEHI